MVIDYSYLEGRGVEIKQSGRCKAHLKLCKTWCHDAHIQCLDQDIKKAQ